MIIGDTPQTATRMITMPSYVYAEADAQRRREGGSGREAIRGGSRHLVSRLVERYLDLLSKPPKSDDQTPVLRMLRGAARGVPANAHRRRLSRKYR
jgi:hypothetical protein